MEHTIPVQIIVDAGGETLGIRRVCRQSVEESDRGVVTDRVLPERQVINPLKVPIAPGLLVTGDRTAGDDLLIVRTHRTGR
jgi:hypothetical protein